MKRFGIKMPNKARSQDARLRVCPVCNLPRYRADFRRSNRNQQAHVICWQCRHDNPKQVAEFYAAGKFKSVAAENEAEKNRRVQIVLNFLKLRNERRKNKAKEVESMAKIDRQAIALVKLPDRIAAILGKTYSVRGDDPNVIPDDEALTRIRDLLDAIDPTLIDRNKNKRLSR